MKRRIGKPRFHQTYRGTIATISESRLTTPISASRAPPYDRHQAESHSGVAKMLPAPTASRVHSVRGTASSDLVYSTSTATRDEERASEGGRASACEPSPRGRRCPSRHAESTGQRRCPAASLEALYLRPAQSASRRTGAGSRGRSEGRAATPGELAPEACTASTVGRNIVRQPRCRARMSQSVSS